MFTPRKGSILILAAALSLAVGLVSTGPVYAQDSTPQPPVPLEDETLLPTPADDPAALVPAPTALPETTPAPEAAGGEDPSVPPPPPPPDLSGVTSGLAATGVVLVDEEDHPLPVISQSVTDGAFPWIRVGTAIHYFATDCTGLTGNCHQGPNPVQGAVNYIVSSGILPTDRAIHIDSSIDVYKEDVRIDGAGNAILKQLNRLEGGCDRGTGLCDTGDPTQTIIEGKLEVIGTLAGFTLQGLTFKGGVTFTGNTGALTVRNVTIDGTGAASGGLSVTDQRGPVTLEGVSVVNSPGTGISIDNSVVIAPVNIVASEGGSAEGMAGEISSRGPVLVNGSAFHEGRAGGLKITTTAPLTVRNSVFNSNTMTSNTLAWNGTGLYAIAATILVDGVYSDRNDRDGIMLNATGAISVMNSRAVMNKRDGLRICKDGDCTSNLPSAGAVTLTLSEFSYNSNGVQLRNIGPLIMSSVRTSGNLGDGLNVVSSNPVTLNGITSSSNTHEGIELDLCKFDSTLNRCTSSASLTFLKTAGENRIFDNQGDGLLVTSGGAVTLNGLNVVENIGRGVVIDNHQAAAAPGVTINQLTVTNSTGRGVDIATRGPVTWTNGFIAMNGGVAITHPGGGAYIDNTYALYAAPVRMTNVDIFGNQNGDGLRITSNGAITLNQVSSSNNNGAGANLNNNTLVGWGGITVTGLATSLSSFNGNNTFGLYVISKGAIILSYVDASQNLQQGIYLDNQTGPTPAPVTLARVNGNNNGTDGGLFIASRGVITITDIEAKGNQGAGAYLDNDGGTGSVTINRTLEGLNLFDNNVNYGLKIDSHGQITLNMISASGVTAGAFVDGFGALINNCDPDTNNQCLGRGGVTINARPGWNNEFNNNAYAGLIVDTAGTITAFNLQANGNGSDGVSLFNNRGLPAPVTVGTMGNTTLSFDGNQGAGLRVFSTGAINVRNLHASNNDGHGAYLRNAYTNATWQPVTVINGVFAGNHNGSGLFIRAKGFVTLTGVDVENSDVHETPLDPNTKIVNRVPNVGTDNVDIYTLSGDGFSHTFALVTETTLSMRLEVYNTSTNAWDIVAGMEKTGSGKLELTTTISTGEYRLLVIGDGTSLIATTYQLTHTNTDPNGNPMSVNYKGTGAYVETNLNVITPVVVSSSSFNGNSYGGLVIIATGAVTLNSLNAMGNSGDGLYVDNCIFDVVSSACSRSAGVTIYGKRNDFSGNRQNGVVVHTRGAINLDNLNTTGNSRHGVSLENWYGTAGVTILSSNPNADNFIGMSGYTGLYVKSAGAIVINGTYVVNNSGYGAFLNNTLGTGGVTITGSDFSGNGINDTTDLGLIIYSKGAVSLNAVEVNGNRGGGAYILNDSSITPQPVTILRSQFNGNQGITYFGLYVKSNGMITLNNVQANDNRLTGAWLQNYPAGSSCTTCASFAPIVLLGTLGENTFNGNGDVGLVVHSNGSVTANRVRANMNGVTHGSKGNGATLTSYNGSITVTDGTFNENFLNGLFAQASKGDVIVTGIRCYSNSFDLTAPADLDTLAGAVLDAGKNVRVFNSAFTANGEYGLRYHTGLSNTFTWVNSTAAGNNFELVGAKNISRF